MNKIPVCLRSDAEEELWWARLAIERGTTLEAWDNAPTRRLPDKE